MESVLKRFENPDEVREFEKGRFEIVRVGGMTIGRATYEPGWKWSIHVGREKGEVFCEVEHVGLVVSGHAVAAYSDGSIADLTPGTVFYIHPWPHDSWVVGTDQYVCERGVVIRVTPGGGRCWRNNSTEIGGGIE